MDALGRVGNLEFVVRLPQWSEHAHPDAWRRVARAAETHGFDGAWRGDHVTDPEGTDEFLELFGRAQSEAAFAFDGPHHSFPRTSGSTGRVSWRRGTTSTARAIRGSRPRSRPT